MEKEASVLYCPGYEAGQRDRVTGYPSGVRLAVGLFDGLDTHQANGLMDMELSPVNPKTPAESCACRVPLGGGGYDAALTPRGEHVFLTNDLTSVTAFGALHCAYLKVFFLGGGSD